MIYLNLGCIVSCTYFAATSDSMFAIGRFAIAIHSVAVALNILAVLGALNQLRC